MFLNSLYYMFILFTFLYKIITTLCMVFIAYFITLESERNCCRNRLHRNADVVRVIIWKCPSFLLIIMSLTCNNYQYIYIYILVLFPYPSKRDMAYGHNSYWKQSTMSLTIANLWKFTRGLNAVSRVWTFTALFTKLMRILSRGAYI